MRGSFGGTAARFGFEQEFFSSRMWIVAISAGSLRCSGMRFNGGHVFLFVALETNLRSLLEQQAGLVGLMGIMASGAIPIAGGVMLEGSLSDLFLQVFVAFKTEGGIGFQQ